MKVKILLENETREEAQELLLKALEGQTNGEVHQEKFQDPAMEHAASEMKAFHDRVQDELLVEVSTILNSSKQ